MIKTMTPEEKKQYRHNAYMKRREKQLQEQHDYYIKHKDEIKKKANKCGLEVKE